MYKWFYNSIPIKKSISDDDIYLLNDEEIKYIKKRENITIFLAAAIGALMVLLLALPQHWFPHWFPEYDIALPFMDEPIKFSVVAFVYGIVLVFIEIVLLTFLNIYCAHEIAVATGFVTKQNKNSGDKQNLLLGIGQEKKTKDLHELGIDPYQGLKKSSIFLMNLFFTLKATLSNLIVKIVIQRVLGRSAIRVVMDMVGIPVFAFWNAWGTRKVLREARTILMGQNYLEHFKLEISKFRELNEKEKLLLYDSLLYIAISKRDYHKNHYFLSKIVVESFKIKTVTNHILSKHYYDEITECTSDFKALNEKIILIGFVLDGTLSAREKIRLKRLNKKGIINKSADEVSSMLENFVYGKGIN